MFSSKMHWISGVGVTLMLCFAPNVFAQKTTIPTEIKIPQNEKFPMRSVRAGTCLMYGSLPLKISKPFAGSASKVTLAKYNADRNGVG